MNVQEMIAALQQQDPEAPAAEAMRMVREQAWRARLKRLTTTEGIAAEYQGILARVTSATDSKGNTNKSPKREAFNALRTEVYEAVQDADPAPSASDLAPMVAALRSAKAKSVAIHEIQKAHNIELWQKADALVAAAGITEEGVV